MKNKLVNNLRREYELTAVIEELINKNLTIPIKTNKQLKSPYGNYSAIKFGTKDNVLIASSSKWSNIQFNFKNFLMDLLPHLAATSGFVANGTTKVNVSLAIIASLGIWKTLIDNKKIELNESHSELIKSIADIEYKEGHTFNNITYELVKLKFDIKGWDINSTINDLSTMKIILYKESPFYLKLREKIVLEKAKKT